MMCSEIEPMLHPLIDDELTSTDIDTVAAHLASCVYCREERARISQLSQKVTAIAPIPVPLTLKNKITAQIDEHNDYKLTSQARWRDIGWLRPTISHAVTFAAGGILVLTLLTMNKPATHTIDSILATHISVLQQNTINHVESNDRHTVKPWFAGQVDFSPPVHNLADHGFHLVSGHVTTLAHTGAVALVYARRKHKISVLITLTDSEINTQSQNPRHQKKNGYNIFHWQQTGFGYWAISDLGSNELRAFVALLLKQE